MLLRHFARLDEIGYLCVMSHTYTIEPIEGGCRVSQVMRYDMRFGPVGRVLDRAMLRRKTDQGIKGFLAGLQATVLADRERSRP